MEIGNSSRSEAGQSLFEIVVALGIGALVVVGLISIAIISISNVNFSKTQSNSRHIAQETIEWLRSERNKDWATFSARGNLGGRIYCMPSLGWTIESTCTSQTQKVSNTNFFRTVKVTQISANELEINVNVYWTDQKGLHETRLDTRFTNIR